VSTSTAGGLRTLTVRITATEPFFFAKALHYSSKSLSVTSVGQTANLVPALFSGRSTCTGSPTPPGVMLNGNVSVTGDIESNGSVNNYGSGTLTGSVVYGPGTGCTTNIGTATNSGGSIPYPFSYTAASFACTYTRTSWSFGTIGNPPWQSGGPSGSGTIAPGTYCATAGDIDVSGSTILPSRVTLVATGRIRISASIATLQAFDASNIIAYTPVVATDCGLPAINIGNGTVTLTGNFYAPSGCINASATTLTETGSLIGDQVQVATGTASTIDSGTGSTGSYWLYQ